MTASTKQNAEGINRRQEAREEVEGTASVKVMEAPFSEVVSKTYDAQLFDVSESGLRLGCEELLDGCTLLIRAQLPGAPDTVPLRGEVRWASFEEDGSYEMGIEFRGNDSPVIIKWHRYLKDFVS